MASFLTTTLSLVFLVCLSHCFSSSSAKGGFSIDLIHRDSPRSPFFNPSQTPSQRLKNAFHRSFGRFSHFNNPTTTTTITTTTTQPEPTVINNRGEYLMELSIGTPPVPIKAIADTGSDLIWTQCKPCVDCYPQTDTIFDPYKSSTYKNVPCSASQCATLKGQCPSGDTGSSSSNACQYQMSYGDQSHTNGDIALETLTLASSSGRNVAFPKTIIGCGHDNGGTFDKNGSGIVGLGGGDESLISQLSNSIDGKFSYCLVPLNTQGDDQQSSKLNFGDNANVSGAGVVSTPIVRDSTRKTFFFLTLEAISVGAMKIPFSSSSSSNSSSSGNIIIDSGTTLTLLEESFYDSVADAVDQAVRGQRTSVEGVPMSLCYTVSVSEQLKVPNITVHFDGADVKLQPKNTFVRVSDEAMCFAFAPAQSLSIYGNLAQSDFAVGYDLKQNTVSFKPTDCTEA